jgi:hypothetical protein
VAELMAMVRPERVELTLLVVKGTAANDRTPVFLLELLAHLCTVQPGRLEVHSRGVNIPHPSGTCITFEHLRDVLKWRAVSLGKPRRVWSPSKNRYLKEDEAAAVQTSSFLEVISLETGDVLWVDNPHLITMELVASLMHVPVQRVALLWSPLAVVLPEAK